MIGILNLLNGEQIIGELQTPEDERCIVTNPFYIVDAINVDGMVGTKLTNVLTFSANDFIIIDKKNILYAFEASKVMSAYYQKIVEITDNYSSEMIIKDAISRIDAEQKKYEKTLQQNTLDKSKLN